MAYSDPRTVCAPWIAAADLCCDVDGEIAACGPDGEPTALVYNWTDDEIILAASNILYARTCYRYPGLCEIEIWPCGKCQCLRAPCGCGFYDALELPTDYPLVSVESVSIDGVELAEEDYRVDQGKYLVRLDGDRWPSCNSFDLPSSSAVEVIVQATVGREPPIELKMAAADLACELKKACNGSENCTLPPNVRSLTRRGVEIEINDLGDLFRDDRFGIPSVDMAIKIHGRCGHHGSVFDPATYHSRGYGTGGPVVP